MKPLPAVLLMSLIAAGCSRTPAPDPSPRAFAAAIAAVSGDNQTTETGGEPEDPLVIAATDPDGNGVAGARVDFSATDGVEFEHTTGFTDDDGRFSTKVRLGAASGRYAIAAVTRTKSGAALRAAFTVIALGYRQTLGRELSEKHCARCHDAASTAERVSNHDNLSVDAHAFSDGAAMNQLSAANLIAVIAHGGPALGKSPEMPPYVATLSPAEIEAIAAYIRAVAN